MVRPAEKAAPADLEQYVTLQMIEDRYKIPYSTLRQKIREGKLPAVKAGKQYRVRLADAQAVAEAGGLK